MTDMVQGFRTSWGSSTSLC